MHLTQEQVNQYYDDHKEEIAKTIYLVYWDNFYNRKKESERQIQERLEEDEEYIKNGEELDEEYIKARDKWIEETRKYYDVAEKHYKEKITIDTTRRAVEIGKKQSVNYSDCKEEIDGVDLKPYLELIRKQPVEHRMFLSIKDHKVIEQKIFKGTQASVNSDPKEMEDFLKRVKQNGAGFYEVHNHPFTIAAIPSSYKIGEDLEGNTIIGGDMKTTQNMIGYCNQEGINFLDDGVVTEFDYYSYKQKEKK